AGTAPPSTSWSGRCPSACSTASARRPRRPTRGSSRARATSCTPPSRTSAGSCPSCPPARDDQAPGAALLEVDEPGAEDAPAVLGLGPGGDEDHGAARTHRAQPLVGSVGAADGDEGAEEAARDRQRAGAA